MQSICLLLLVLALVVSTETIKYDPHHFQQCLRKYATDLSKLTQESSANILEMFNYSQSKQQIPGQAVSLYHLGPFQLHLDFEIALSQLNLTFAVGNSFKTNCGSSSTSHLDEIDQQRLVYGGNIENIALLDVINPSMRFVLSDTDIRQYLLEKRSDCSSPSRQGCYAPLPFVVDYRVPKIQSLLVEQNIPTVIVQGVGDMQYTSTEPVETQWFSCGRCCNLLEVFSLVLGCSIRYGQGRVTPQYCEFPNSH